MICAQFGVGLLIYQGIPLLVRLITKFLTEWLVNGLGVFGFKYNNDATIDKRIYIHDRLYERYICMLSLYMFDSYID